MKYIKRQNGSITVEAATILFIFLFAMLALMSIMNMVRSQVVIQNALNQSAKEVSQYSYILYRFGYFDYVNNMAENENDFDEKVNKYANPANAQEAKDNLIGLMKKFNNDGGSEILDEVVKGCFAKASNYATENAENFVFQNMAKSAMDDYVDSVGGDEYLKKIGIKDGKAGLKYSGTYDKDNSIVICVDYKMSLKFPFIDVEFSKPVHLTAVTAAWAGGCE